MQFTPPEMFNDTFDTLYTAPGGIYQKRKVQLSTKYGKFRRGLGIFCLAESADDHLMWVNYARNRTGFIIGFDAKSEFFSRDGKVLGPVHYIRGPPDAPDEPHLALSFYKSEDWKHEREWRCVKEFTAEEKSRLIDFSEYYGNIIREIIIGDQADAATISRLVFLIDVFQMKHVKFYLSQRNPHKWAFSRQPKTYSVCSCCKGRGYTEE